MRRLAALGVLLALLSPWWGPPALRPLAFFRVRHVEVRGWHYATPARVAQRLRLDTAFSIWNDLAPLETRVLADSVVREVHISRHLPATLVVNVLENDPVAIVSGSAGFAVYDANGKLLPIDLTRKDVDVPIIQRRDTMLLRLLGEIKAGNPAFFSRVSDVQRVGGGEVLFHLLHVDVRTTADVSVERFAQISSVEQDLVHRHLQASELDLRFRDQVIARLP